MGFNSGFKGLSGSGDENDSILTTLYLRVNDNDNDNNTFETYFNFHSNYIFQCGVWSTDTIRHCSYSVTPTNVTAGSGGLAAEGT